MTHSSKYLRKDKKMKALSELKNKGSKKSKDNNISLFSWLSKANQQSIFDSLFDEESQKKMQFVQPVPSIDEQAVAFFDASLTASQLKAVTDDGFTKAELLAIEDLIEYGIIAISCSDVINQMMSLSTKVHELRFWLKDNRLYIYCQIGAKYSYTVWDI